MSHNLSLNLRVFTMCLFTVLFVVAINRNGNIMRSEKETRKIDKLNFHCCVHSVASAFLLSSKFFRKNSPAL